MKLLLKQLKRIPLFAVDAMMNSLPKIEVKVNLIFAFVAKFLLLPRNTFVLIWGSGTLLVISTDDTLYGLSPFG